MSKVKLGYTETMEKENGNYYMRFRMVIQVYRVRVHIGILEKKMETTTL